MGLSGRHATLRPPRWRGARPSGVERADDARGRADDDGGLGAHEAGDRLASARGRERPERPARRERREEHVDLVDAGIIDPTKVVRIALENAVSVASVLLLTEATMTEKPEKRDERAPAEPPL